MYRLLGILGMASWLCLTANADTFQVIFHDSTFNGPAVGSGTFSFPEDLSDGTYTLGDLSSYRMNFLINFPSGPEMFTEADLCQAAGMLSSLQFTVYNHGTQFHFSGFSGCGFGGSMEFDKPDGAVLSTEPDFMEFSSANLGYISADSKEQRLDGIYTSQAVPEPESIWLVSLGVSAILVLGRIRRRR